MTLRYHSLNEEVKRVFGKRIDRITVNAHMTCPNIDGKKAKGGCTFCSDASYEGLTLLKERVGIQSQIDNGMAYVRQRYPSTQFFVYFQNGTNTYDHPDKLRAYFNQALSYKDVVGVFLATRPDCLSDEVIEVLDELNSKTYLWVEQGIPSHKNEINKKLNRAHTVEDFVNSSERLSKKSIRNCAHIMIGLPGENTEDNIEKARFISALPVQGVKIHNLVVFKDTVLEKQYKAGLYEPLTLDDYTSQCVDFLEYLRRDIVVMRLNAHGPRRVTIAPDWSVNKWEAINSIHKEMERRDTYQGRFV